MTWRKVALSELCTIEKGLTGIQKAIPGKYPMVVTSEARKSSNEYQFDGEAVIIPLVSSTGHGHRSLNRIHFQNGKFALGSILCAVIPKDKSILSAEYLYRYLDLNKENELVSRMRGMANVTLPINEIRQIEIPLPPLSEQMMFVIKFQKLESQNSELSADLTHQLDLVKQLRQSFLREAMQGILVKQDSNDEPASELLKKIKAEKEQLVKQKKIRKDKELPPIKPEEIPFEIPKNWAWCRFGEVVHSMANGIYKEEKFYNVNGVACFRMYNIREGKINFENVKRMILTTSELETYKLEENDLLLNRVNSIELLGKCGLIKNLSEPFVFESKNIRVRLFNKGFLAPFINFMFMTPLIREQIYFAFKKVTGQASISQEKLFPIMIPLPPLAEEHRIVAKLEQLMDHCDELEKSIKQSQTRNEQLLKQVLREALQPKTTYFQKINLV